MKKINKRRIQGQGMTEYIIIVAVIAILSVAVITAFGNQLRDLFFKSGKTLSSGSTEIMVEDKMGDGSSVDKALGGNN